MLGHEDDDTPPPPPPQPPPPPLSHSLPQPPPSARKTYSRSVSWAGSSSPARSSPINPKSLWNSKARGCLPPLSVLRPRAEEWPTAGSDDLGVWPNVPTTPGPRPTPPLPEFEFKKDKLAHFDKECSRITDHVYLGSDSVAKSRDILRENSITHVLNCVGFVCPEYFKNELVYKTLWLRDSPSEDITSILYDVFDYFEDVRAQNGRVLVHCCHGVSRSTSLVIAYLMWTENRSFEDSLERVKAARGVTNPNMGFACQLLQCQKRVHAVPVSPGSVLRMFRMAPHSPYAPLHLVPKLLTQPNAKALDSRGAFVVLVPGNVYVWVGKSCGSLLSETAGLAASQVIRYEKAAGPALRIMEGEEPHEFWCALGGEREGEGRVGEYDLDFEVFNCAATGGVVPPLAVSGEFPEMQLPARQSGWDMITTDHSRKESECPDSPDSFASCPASPRDQDVLSCFRVKDSRKFVNSSPSISPSTSEYASSFTFSPTSDSSSWSDPGQTGQTLVKSWPFLEDQNMKDDDFYDTCETITEMADFVLYQWPTMEKVELGCLGLLDSRSVYMVTGKPEVLYIWVGREVSSGGDGGGTEGGIGWQTAGRDFLVGKGLTASSIVQVVREGEEPEELLNHIGLNRAEGLGRFQKQSKY